MKNDACRRISLGLAMLMLVVLVGTALCVPAVAAGAPTGAIVRATVYHPNLDSGYGLENPTEATAFGDGSYSSLLISTSTGGSVASGTVGGYYAYGIVGSEVSLAVKIPSETDFGDYELCMTDSHESVSGIKTGRVDSGALIVQTSSDGKSWSDKSVTVTTDFYNYVKNKQRLDSYLQVYTIKGSSISSGIYVRVLYAYEAVKPLSCSHKNSWWDRLWGASTYKHANDNQYENYVDAYTFYVFNNNPSAVTFRNLSVSGALTEALEGQDGAVVTAYRKAESMLSNSYTTKGFTIDNSLNLASKLEVYRNGTKISIPTSGTFTEDGKYEVVVRTPIGTTARTTLYVDTATDSAVAERYFGDGGFLSGSKRIYSADSEYPVYEGGFTFYNLEAVSAYQVPLKGTLTNLTTGETEEIHSSREARSGQILEAGEYYAELHTDCAYYGATASGDARSFGFRFRVIEKGTAPGPVVNRESLAAYSETQVSDLCPRYYGISFSGAGAGVITLAFPTYQDALLFACEYEKGTVEIQTDGSYRYRGSLSVKQKTVYRDNWDLTDATYYFASEAVQELWFDLSDEFTYRTVDRLILDRVTNIRTLELDRSVVILAPGYSFSDFKAEGTLPLLSPKKYATYVRDENGDLAVKTGAEDYRFVSDKLGIDSCLVTVTDSDGVTYPITYGEGVGAQLEAAGCATGVVTVRESTVYGDACEYQALFLAEGQNTVRLVMDVSFEGKKSAVSIDQSKVSNEAIKANAISFSLAEDSLDPYSFVKVSKDGSDVGIYTLEELEEAEFSEAGTYTFACVNRLGYCFSFSVECIPTFTVSLSGIGCEEFEDITVSYGERCILLPVPTRYGYWFGGYAIKGEGDETLCYSLIDQYNYLQDLTLEPVWRAESFLASFVVDGETVGTKRIWFDETFTLPTPTLAEHLEFDCWVLNGEELEDDEFLWSEASDLTFVAKYHSKEYTLKLIHNGALLDTLTVKYGETVALPVPDVEVGSEFRSWDGSQGTFFDSYTHLLASDVELYASVEAKEYSVVCTVNGRQMESFSLRYGDRLTLPVPEAKIGEKFGGWLYNGTLQTSYLHQTDGDVTLEAKFVPIEYTVSFLVAGRVVYSESLHYGETITLEFPVIPEGYIFWGWLLDGKLWSDTTYTHLTEDLNVYFVAHLEREEQSESETEAYDVEERDAAGKMAEDESEAYVENPDEERKMSDGDNGFFLEMKNSAVGNRGMTSVEEQDNSGRAGLVVAVVLISVFAVAMLVVVILLLVHQTPYRRRY